MVFKDTTKSFVVWLQGLWQVLFYTAPEYTTDELFILLCYLFKENNFADFTSLALAIFGVSSDTTEIFKLMCSKDPPKEKVMPYIRGTKSLLNAWPRCRPDREAFRVMFRTPLEYVPLHIAGHAQLIARWRLEIGK